MSQTQEIISVEDLKKNYGEIKALVGGSFKVRKGEIIALLGPNGAGKTTMIKILTGYLEPTSGTVHVDGLDIEKNRQAVQQLIGYLPENAPIYPEMLVQEYLLFAGRLRNIPLEKLQSQVIKAIERTGLEQVVLRPIGELSKGYKQRVGLAQAILHDPKLLILDEPTNGLDPTQIVEIRNLIRDLAKNATVMLSTHILSEAEATCDRAIIISKGAIKADARLADLSKSSEVILRLSTKGADLDQIATELKGLSGVTNVAVEDGAGQDVHCLRVMSGDETSDAGRKLAQEVFARAKEGNWPVYELRPESKTLEAVFREHVVEA